MDDEKRLYRRRMMRADRRYKNREFIDRSRPLEGAFIETLTVSVPRTSLHRGDGSHREGVNVASYETGSEREDNNQQ